MERWTHREDGEIDNLGDRDIGSEIEREIEIEG